MLQWGYVEPDFTIFTLIYKYAFVIISVIYLFAYLYLMRPIKIEQMSPEQKMYYVLVIFLIFFNDPFCVANVYNPNWFWTALSQFFVSYFVMFLLYMFAFSFYRAKEEISITTTYHNLKKLIFFFIFSIISFAVYIYSIVQMEIYPYNYMVVGLDKGTLALIILEAICIIVYSGYIIYLIITSCRRVKTM